MGLGERLDTIARWFAGIKFQRRNRSGEFSWEVSRKGNTLTFRHDDLSLSVSNWQLVSEELWKERELNRSYSLVSGFGIQHFYYLGDIKWAAAGQSGKGEGIIFGLPSDRDRLFGPLRVRHQAEFSLLSDLIVELERVLKYQFHTGLLEKQPAVPRRFVDDRRVKQKQF